MESLQLNSAKLTALTEELKWSETTRADSVEIQWANIKNVILSLRDKTVPLVPVKKSSPTPWLQRKHKRAKARKDRAYAILMKTNTQLTSLSVWLTVWKFCWKIFESNLLKSISQRAIKLFWKGNPIKLHNLEKVLKPGKLRRHPNIRCGNVGEPLIREHLCMGDNRIKLHNKAS